MKRLLAASVGLVVLVGLALGMSSRSSGSTGDRKLDSTLERIRIEANADPDQFINQLGSRYSILEQEIRQAMEMFGLAGPDIFMATALAKATQRPVLTIAEGYKKNPGKGWGVMAKDLGIKPGSREFHQLKSDAQGLLNDMRSAAKAKQKHEREMKKAPEQKIKKDPQEKGRGKS